MKVCSGYTSEVAVLFTGHAVLPTCPPVNIILSVSVEIAMETEGRLGEGRLVC